jgi:hypothetical protein
MATVALQQRSGVFYAVCAEVLQAGQVSEESEAIERESAGSQSAGEWVS